MAVREQATVLREESKFFRRLEKILEGTVKHLDSIRKKIGEPDHIEILQEDLDQVETLNVEVEHEVKRIEEKFERSMRNGKEPDLNWEELEHRMGELEQFMDKVLEHAEKARQNGRGEDWDIEAFEEKVWKIEEELDAHRSRLDKLRRQAE